GESGAGSQPAATVPPCPGPATGGSWRNPSDTGWPRRSTSTTACPVRSGSLEEAVRVESGLRAVHERVAVLRGPVRYGLQHIGGGRPRGARDGRRRSPRRAGRAEGGAGAQRERHDRRDHERELLEHHGLRSSTSWLCPPLSTVFDRRAVSRASSTSDGNLREPSAVPRTSQIVGVGDEQTDIRGASSNLFDEETGGSADADAAAALDGGRRHRPAAMSP